MKAALFCFSDRGAVLAQKLRAFLPEDDVTIHAPERIAAAYGFLPHAKISAAMDTLFHENEALLFIGACGIAVRYIAPYVRSKTTDPAVLVFDDGGRFVIPVLSGHIGGANALAEKLAGGLGAVPVITTATDGCHRFSCDTWATTHACALSSLSDAKAFSAAILTQDLPVSAEFPLPDTLPAGLSADAGEKAGADIGLYIGLHTVSPYARTLRLIPQIVTLGIGCRRNTPEEAIRQTVQETLAAAQLDSRSVIALASIDVKADEAGLLAYAGAKNLPIHFYTAAELDAVEGDFEESAFVRKTVGVGNVCERAAACAGGTLIIRKTAARGVTVAAAVQNWRITF